MRYSSVTTAVVGLWALAACQLPEAPQWDVGVAVPYTSDTVTVFDFLPDVVSVDTVVGTPVFVIDPQADSVDYRLGEMCSACLVLDGQTVQVPSFEFIDSLDVLFPAELVTIDVIGGQMELRVTNEMNFDPLRPNPIPANAGYISLAARDIATGATIDSVLISGSSEAMAPGETESFVFNIADQEISEGVRIVFHIVSPQDNQTVTIDTNLGAKVAGLLRSIQVRGIAVVVEDGTLDEQNQVSIDQEVRDELANRVQGGAFELELLHNLELTGSFRASIAGSPGDLFSNDPTREVPLSQLALTPGISQSGELTVEQLQQIATFPTVFIGVQAVASGTETGPSGQTYVAQFTPDQFLLVDLRVTSVLRVDF